MQLDKYLRTSAAVLEVAKAREIGAAKYLLDAIEFKRNEIRREIEENPVRSDVLKKDVAFLLGVVAGLNWVLKLPEQARAWLEILPDGREDEP